MKPMSIRFPVEMHERLRWASFKLYKSMNDIVIEAVEKELEALEKEWENETKD